MTRIRDIRLIPLAYAIADNKVYGTARETFTQREASLIEILTTDGVTGLGEASGPATLTLSYLELIKDAFIGRDLFDREIIWNDILTRRYRLGIQSQMTACYAGINIAIHDAIGKTLGVPVCKLLGGRGKDNIQLCAADGYFTRDPDNQLPDQLERFAEAGFQGAKIQIGQSPKSDEARCSLAREVLGDDALLLVDAHGNYSLDLALESMNRIAPLNIHLFEEPLPPPDIEGYRLLSRRACLPVAAGEALHTLADFSRLLLPRAIDMVQPDLTLCGGFDQARAIIGLCQVQNVRIMPHVWGSSIGFAAAIHFMAALPDFPHGDHLPYPRLLPYDLGDNPLLNEVLTEPLRIDHGAVDVPAGPGLGIELDLDAIEPFRQDR